MCDILYKSVWSLYNRIFKVDSPVAELNKYFLAQYLCHGTITPNTLLQRVISHNLSPIDCMFNSPTRPKASPDDGVTDSLKLLLYSEQFLKPYSDERYLAHLLVKSF